MKQRVPVLMYHSVGVPNKMWRWNYLTCPYQNFENQLKWLKKLNFNTINLNDLYGYINENKIIPSRSIVLTFDDGYVDNWIYAYPLLKKYGFKGTIFVNPEFVDTRDFVRKRFDQVDNLDVLEKSGFLSWQEMRLMEDDGTINIQSHAMTHTHYPISDKIIDFRNPIDSYIWLSWNSNIENKPFLQIDDNNLKLLGEPVYEMGASLRFKRCFPDNRIKDRLVSFVRKNGGREFFNNSNWESTLLQEVSNYKNNNKILNKYETDSEFEDRILKELINSKTIIEEKLHKQVDFLCWPEGSATQLGIQLTEQIGYKMTTAAKDIPKIRKKIPNSPEMIINRVRRFSPVLYWNGIEGFDAKMKYMNGFELALKILCFKNIMFSKYWGNIILKIIGIIRRDY